MPLPKRFAGRIAIAAVREEAEPLEPGVEAAEERRVAGRVMARREMGKLAFLDLVDRSGRIQLLLSGEHARAAEDVHLGDIVGATGRPGKTRRGEVSLFVTALEVLARNGSPLPDTFHGLTDVELRYRKRYLDLLMNEETRREAQVRARMIGAIRAYLDGEGFVEVETPILQPRYGGGFAEPFVTHSDYLEQDVYLRIADELYLKRLIVGGLEKVYEISKDFRNESISYKHQPEFTMLEWYEAFADYEDAMALVEDLLRVVTQEATGSTKVAFRRHEIDFGPVWKRLSLIEALQDEGVWTRDANDLRKRLQEREVDTGA